MILTLDPETIRKLADEARNRGMSPEQFAESVIHERLAAMKSLLVPKDEWERRLMSLGKDRGRSLSNEALSSEGIYE